MSEAQPGERAVRAFGDLSRRLARLREELTDMHDDATTGTIGEKRRKISIATLDAAVAARRGRRPST